MREMIECDNKAKA